VLQRALDGEVLPTDELATADADRVEQLRDELLALGQNCSPA